MVFCFGSLFLFIITFVERDVGLWFVGLLFVVEVVCFCFVCWLLLFVCVGFGCGYCFSLLLCC